MSSPSAASTGGRCESLIARRPVRSVVESKIDHPTSATAVPGGFISANKRGAGIVIGENVNVARLPARRVLDVIVLTDKTDGCHRRRKGVARNTGMTAFSSSWPRHPSLERPLKRRLTGPRAVVKAAPWPGRVNFRSRTHGPFGMANETSWRCPTTTPRHEEHHPTGQMSLDSAIACLPFL